MATVAHERGHYTYERGKDEVRTSLLAKVGGMIVGLMAAPTGKHSEYYINKQRAFEANEQTPSRGIARLALNKLFGRASSTTPAEQRASSGDLQPQQPPHDWDMRMLDLMDPSQSVDSLPELENAIHTSRDFNELEKRAWQAGAIARMGTGLEKDVAERLASVAEDQLQNPPVATSYSDRFSLRYRHKVRAEAAAAAEAAHPTVKLPVQR